MRIRLDHGNINRVVSLLRTARAWPALSNGNSSILHLVVRALLIILYLLRKGPDARLVLLLVQLKLLFMQLLARREIKVANNISDIGYSILTIRIVIRRVDSHLLILVVLSVVHKLHISLNLRSISIPPFCFLRVNKTIRNLLVRWIQTTCTLEPFMIPRLVTLTMLDLRRATSLIALLVEIFSC